MRMSARRSGKGHCEEEQNPGDAEDLTAFRRRPGKEHVVDLVARGRRPGKEHCVGELRHSPIVILIVQPMMKIGTYKPDGWGKWDDEIYDRRGRSMVLVRDPMQVYNNTCVHV
ncbi:hypothetical protein Rs2_41186 [Raphanus sativus]|nr:hypothetical protein Rs2_41186 [Raphanus sativus]